MNDTIKTYLTEAYEAKAHRQTMVSKIEELKEMIGINDTAEVAENEPEVAPV